MKRGCLVLVLVLSLVSGVWAQQGKAAAGPALWKVKGVHGTVYLFGTVHLMRKSTVWETPAIQGAFKASDTLYLEIADIDPAAMQKMQPMILQMGMDAEHPLSTKIAKEDVDLLDKAVKDLGLPGEAAFEPFKPWLVYLTLEALPAMKAGYDPLSGIDQVLAGESKAATKPVKGFETAEEQMHLLADLPEAQQVEALHQTLADLPKSVSEIDEIAADWARGDVGAIAKLGDGELKEKSPELYQALLVKRNERFAVKIGELPNDSGTGTVFVAVGAAHLAGEASVVKLLEGKGFTVTRVE